MEPYPSTSLLCFCVAVAMDLLIQGPESLGAMSDNDRILEVKNWRKYQHYADRSPPWIKVHARVLNDQDFMSLTMEQRGLLMQIWVLASEDDGKVCEQTLAFRLRVLAVDCKPLIDKGFLVVCKQVLASAPPSVSPSLSVSILSGGSGGNNLSTFEGVIAELQTHDSFRSVPAVAIENALKGYDRSKWPEAVKALLLHWAGARIPKPCGSLCNYLNGKAKAGPQKRKPGPEFTGGQSPSAVYKPSPEFK